MKNSLGAGVMLHIGSLPQFVLHVTGNNVTLLQVTMASGGSLYRLARKEKVITSHLHP